MKILDILLVTPVRIALGALFVFAAFLKLKDPQAFAEAVKAFKIFDLDTAAHLVVMAAFTVPWLEMLCGILLIFGLWTRAAALALTGLILAFTVGIISVLVRDLDVSCGCFGDYEWPCKGNIGTCHVLRNSVLLASSLLVLWRGGGPLALDRLRLKAKPVDSDPVEA
jgi:putative oxidoreductase